MIRCLTHQEIDKRWYDALIARCPNAVWYARSAVLDVASPGWQLLVDDTAEAVMPLTRRRRWGMEYLYQPYGLQYLGVFATRTIDDALCSAFLQAIPASYNLVDICMGPGTFSISRSYIAPRVNLCMPLPKDAASHRAGYAKGHIRNLRTSIPTDVKWSQELVPEEFLILFQRTTARRHGGLRERDASVLGSLLKLAAEEGTLRWMAFRRQDQLLAAMAFVHWGGRHILFKTAVSEEAQTFRAGFHLVDGYLAAHAGAHELFDLAGSVDPAVARFYKGFGASEVPYFRVLINRLPWPLRWLK
ncbi:MAG: GNAT family N-acetyltransferase [Flavobacteriales bacterium]|nr:GNAT family N-acetyltransferase [Flavobacteriales bacterium]